MHATAATITPNKAAIRQWVAALRSGGYEQTTGVLTRVDREGNATHCCLGVACDLFAEEAGITSTTHYGGVRGYVDGYITIHSLLPLSIQKHLGMDSNDPRVNILRTKVDASGLHVVTKATMHLSGLNDSGQYSFADIALTIENTYLIEEETSGTDTGTNNRSE